MSRYTEDARNNWDEIEILSVPFWANHGVFEEEQRLGQRFVLSLRLYLSTRCAGKTDDLTKTLHYGEVMEQAIHFLQEHTYQLLEAAAEAVAEELLLTREVLQGVEVTLEKPSAPVSFSFEHIGVRIFRQKHVAYLSIGSNMGDREAYLQSGLAYLRETRGIRILQVSSLMETEPWGYTEQPAFLNGAVAVETVLLPWELLDVLQAAEQAAGRKRELHWGPRTLDMDLLLYDQEQIGDERLCVPHPQMHRRMFVLEPLKEIAPYLEHPRLHKNITELYEAQKEMES